jgi:IMP dehydrogenase
MLDFSKKIVGEALTYDDVLLIPSYSEILPREVSIQSKISKNIVLNVPIVSAAMDTVTEHHLAIAIAQEGGLGILHKNMSITAQAEMVRKVKRAESGLIVDPITLNEDATVGDAHQLMNEHSIGGIPIVTKDGQLVGIVTNRDLRFEKIASRKITDVMTKDRLVTAPEGTTLKEAEAILQEFKIEKLLVTNSAGKLVGLITFKDILKVKDHPNACKDSMGRLRVGAAVGVTADMMERLEALVKAGVDVVTIDTAHGHSKGVIEAVRRAKLAFPQLDIIAGNIATGAAAKALAEAGADAVKVGIGPGSICTTRIIAGVGVPQLSALFEVSEALKGYCKSISRRCRLHYGRFFVRRC